ncbi:MAG: HD domain-containing protein [Eubacteriales bacterium]|jgi:HD superfamily phosphodiesterase
MQVMLQQSQAEQYNDFSSQLNPAWFFSPEGIHGLSHAKRVLLHALLLSHELELNQRDTALLCYSAIYHDIGRTNDDYEETHGSNSCSKIMRLNLPVPQDEEDRNILFFIIFCHSVEDEDAAKYLATHQIRDTQRAIALLKVFKDCDALDRVRVDHLNLEYLRHEQTKKYVRFAWDIFRNPFILSNILI